MQPTGAGEQPPRGPVRETERVHDPEREELRDRIRSLTTALVLTALLALAGLGVALWALLGEDEDEGNGRQGASPARVSNLEDRVDELEGQIENRATDGDIEDLEQRIEEVEQQAEEGGDTEQLQQSIETLDQNVQELAERVDALEQEQQGGATTEP